MGKHSKEHSMTVSNNNPMAPYMRLMTWASMLGSHGILFLATTQVLMKSFHEKPEGALIGTIAYAVAVIVAIIGLLFLRHSKKVQNGQPYFIVSMAVFEMIAAIGMVAVILGVPAPTYYGLAASGLLLHLTAFPFKRS